MRGGELQAKRTTNPLSHLERGDRCALYRGGFGEQINHTIQRPLLQQHEAGTYHMSAGKCKHMCMCMRMCMRMWALLWMCKCGERMCIYVHVWALLRGGGW